MKRKEKKRTSAISQNVGFSFWLLDGENLLFIIIFLYIYS